MSTIYCAADHAGVLLKGELIQALKSEGQEVVDLGTHGEASVDYPDYTYALVKEIEKDPLAWGILICGSGIGVSIAANRFSFIRAALCHTPDQARLARAHNNANVLCLGSREISSSQALTCVKTFLHTSFEGGRHQQRVEKLKV